MPFPTRPHSLTHVRSIPGHTWDMAVVHLRGQLLWVECCLCALQINLMKRMPWLVDSMGNAERLGAAVHLAVEHLQQGGNDELFASTYVRMSAGRAPRGLDFFQPTDMWEPTDMRNWRLLSDSMDPTVMWYM